MNCLLHINQQPTVSKVFCGGGKTFKIQDAHLPFLTIYFISAHCVLFWGEFHSHLLFEEPWISAVGVTCEKE